MYGDPVKSPFPLYSTRRGRAVVNNHLIARRRGARGMERRNSSVLSPPFFLSCFLLTLFHAFIFCLPPPPPPSLLSMSQSPLLSCPFYPAFFSPACLADDCWKKGGIASLAAPSFESSQRFCFARESAYSSLAHHHPKHQLPVMVIYGP